MFKYKHGHHKRDFTGAFLQYGIQVLMILVIVNFVVFYATNFFLRAQNHSGENLSGLSPSPSPDIPSEVFDPPTPTETGVPTPTPSPVGPVVGIVFRLPGIGSGSAVLEPLHKIRSLSILLYGQDKYSYNKQVKPIYTIKTQVKYDDDENSPTYSSFVNDYIDLGVLEDASYQVVLKSNRTMPQLVMSNDPVKVGGQLFSFIKGAGGYGNLIPAQMMISGDIFPYPDGDGVMDISDYNALVNCFGSKVDTSKCDNKLAGDLDDNSVLDGTDYNLMLLGFKSIMALGLPVPSIIITPTPKPTKPPKPTLAPDLMATPAANVKSGGGGGLIVLFVFLLFLGGGIFVLFKTKKGRALMERFGKKKKADTESGEQVAVETTGQPVISETESQPVGQEPTTLESTVSETQEEARETGTDEQTVAAPAVPMDSGVVDNTFFVKIKTSDDSGTWVLLTDDNGPVNGFFAGKDIKDGFARVKGAFKNDAEGKKYVEISEMTPSE